MVLLLLSLNVWAQPQPCGTPDHFRDFIGVERPPTGPPTPDLTDHEVHGSIENVRYSEHFALKWGPSHVVTELDVARILGDFEYAHSIQVEAWSMDEPTGVGGTYFNVYLGDTGGAVPSVLGNAGYYTTDDFGYPMIVIGKHILPEVGYARSVIAHEFFHAVQHASEAFYDWETGGWYWEATATWAAGEVVPESNTYCAFLPFYALQPQRGLYHHSIDDFGGTPPDLHQYGAFIFPRFISEQLGLPEAIHSSWREGTEGDDPVQVLRTLLGETEFNAAFVKHGAHNLTWDYADSESYNYWVDGYAEGFASQDLRSTTIELQDDTDWYTPVSGGALAPVSYMSFPIPEGWLDGDQLTVKILPNGPDAESSDAQLIGQVTSFADGNPESVPEYIGLSTTAVHDTVTVDTGAWLWLTVANVASKGESSDSVPYKVSFLPRDDPTPEPEDTGDPEVESADTGSSLEEPVEEEPFLPDVEASGYTLPKEPGGCNCTSGPLTGGPWFLALLPLVFVRRSDSPTG